MGRANGVAGFAFGGNGARKLSKACNTCNIAIFRDGEPPQMQLSHLGDPQTKGNKIRSSCLTPAFSGAQERA